MRLSMILNLPPKRQDAALEECRWNKTATAKLLGISFRSLRYRLKKLGLDE
jgi:two-component system response regulator PilR (NtrC family)